MLCCTCFRLDSCVGLRNKRWFILLLWSMVFGASFNAYVILKQICPTESWNCKGIFSQPDELVKVSSSRLALLFLHLHFLAILLNLSHNVTNKMPSEQQDIFRQQNLLKKFKTKQKKKMFYRKLEIF